MLGKIGAAMRGGRPNTPLPWTGSAAGTPSHTVESAAEALPEASAQTIAQLREFCQLWHQDLSRLDYIDSSTIWECLRKSRVDMTALRCRLPAELQAELADLIAQSCRKTSDFNRVPLIHGFHMLSALSLKALDPEMLTPLTDHLLLVIKIQRDSYHADPLGPEIRDLQAMLPQASRDSLQRQIEGHVLARLTQPDLESPVLDGLLTAIDCIADSGVRCSLLLSWLEALDTTAEGLRGGNTPLVAKCLMSFSELAPDLPHDCWPQIVLRFNRLDMAYEAVQVGELGSLQSSIDLANGAVACLSGDPHQKTQAMRAFLRSPSTPSVEGLSMVVRLADHANSDVGIYLHECINSMSRDDRIGFISPVNQFRLAVLSFHVDPGDAPYFEIEADGGPQRVDYPDWLVDMRRQLSAGWTELRSLEQSQQYFHIKTALNFSFPTPEVLIAQYAGPRVTCADWPALEKYLQARYAR